jgi:hypothetical protein
VDESVNNFLTAAFNRLTPQLNRAG